MEILVWIGFLIVYSIVQSLNKKKKKQAKSKPQTSGDAASSPPTLQDALREIQVALEGKPSRGKPVEPTAQPIPLPAHQDARLQLPSSREPEFHSLEKDIPDRSLESKTKYSTKVYTQTIPDRTKTYEDSFPDSEFYDDTYHHAHMEEAPIDTLAIKKKDKSHATFLRSQLRDRNYLSEAFILQQILGKPLSKKR